MRVVIADDEPLALRRLEIALDAIPDVEIVGVADDGEQALDLIDSLSPDIVLLDIRMPEMSGLELVDALDHPSPPAVIFITAYDSFAVEAFREGAIDYLLKPLDEDRLRIAIERAQLALATRDASQRIAELREALTSLQREEAAREKPAYEEYIWVSSRGQVIRVPVDDVHWFEAEGDYVVIHADRESPDSRQLARSRISPRSATVSPRSPRRDRLHSVGGRPGSIGFRCSPAAPRGWAEVAVSQILQEGDALRSRRLTSPLNTGRALVANRVR